MPHPGISQYSIHGECVSHNLGQCVPLAQWSWVVLSADLLVIEHPQGPGAYWPSKPKRPSAGAAFGTVLFWLTSWHKRYLCGECHNSMWCIKFYLNRYEFCILNMRHSFTAPFLSNLLTLFNRWLVSQQLVCCVTGISLWAVFPQ